MKGTDCLGRVSTQAPVKWCAATLHPWPTHDAETDAIVAQLGEAGLIEVYVNEEGKETYRLTAKGAPVARAIALAGEDGETVLDALLGGGDSAR